MNEFPVEWDVVRLGEVVDILDSRRVPLNARQRATRPGDVPYYGATGQVGWIDEPIFNEPLVLLGEDGVQFLEASKQKAYLIDGPAWVNNHAHVLRARSVVERGFLNHYLNAADYRGLANGTTRLKLTQAAMKRICVPLPPLDEQRRIVDLLEDHLSRLDAALMAVRTSIRRSSAMVRSSLAAAVTAATDSPMSTVGSEAQLVQYGTSAKCHEAPVDGDIPVLRMGNVKDCEVDWEGLKYLPRHHQDFPKLLLTPGDLLFNRTNSAELVGKSAVFDADSPASLASYLIRVRFKETVDPHWANMVINSSRGRAYIASVASQQVGQANVNGTKLRAFPLPLPSLARQRELVVGHQRVREAARRLSQSAEVSMRRATALRRSLLSAAFSGQLTASPEDLSVVDETAMA